MIGPSSSTTYVISSYPSDNLDRWNLAVNNTSSADTVTPVAVCAKSA
ncbi:hypothetical protein GXW82_22120 [Streptacidiphilus sp. 4-A2]|nr:hypothetical protein [Streptacidiphilus sp. 4-A2]